MSIANSVDSSGQTGDNTCHCSGVAAIIASSLVAYSWVKIRSNDLYSTYEEMKMYDWVGTVASIPGEWDCVAMIYGETYQEVYNYLWELTTKGYDVEYYAPLKYYWNKDYVENWNQKTVASAPARTY